MIFDPPDEPLAELAEDAMDDPGVRRAVRIHKLWPTISLSGYILACGVFSLTLGAAASLPFRRWTAVGVWGGVSIIASIATGSSYYTLPVRKVLHWLSKQGR